MMHKRELLKFWVVVMQHLMPKMSPVPNSEKWQLLEDWVYTAKNGEVFTVPVGFVTDLDSVPRIPFIYAIYKGRIRAAAVLHDFLYKSGFSRLRSDELLFECGEVLDCVKVEYLHNIYAAVRAFGWAKYKAKKNEEIVINGGSSGGAVDAAKKSSWVAPETAAPYLDAIKTAENKYGLPNDLLARLLYQESAYREDIINGQTVSSAGAVGIAQIVPVWHPDANPLDPFESIDYAGKYLSKLKKYFGDWRTVLAAYNWGWGNVSDAKGNYGESWLNNAPKETQDYVEQITADVAV